MKKFLAVLCSLATLACGVVAFSACGVKDPVPEGGGYALKIGYTQMEPMNYFDESGKLIGFETEFAEKVCGELGYTPEFIEIDWNTKETSLKAGEIDLIWNGMTIQPEMENNLAISKPYMTNSQVMLVRADSDLTYEKIMADKDIRITAEGDSAGAAWIADNGFTQFINADNQIKTMTEVKANTADVAVLDNVLANYYITNDESSFEGELKIVEDENGKIKTLTDEVYGIAAKKGNVGLITKVNDVLASL